MSIDGIIMDHKALIKRFVIGEFSLKRIMRFFVILYLSVGIWAYFYAERIIFQPGVSSYQPAPDLLALTTVKGVKITALYLNNPNAQYTLLYSHGNAEDLGDNRFLLEEWRQLGFSVFAYDYPGYGTSEGKPSEQGTYEAIDAAYSYLTQQLKIKSDRIIIYGRSVGGGPSVDLASRQPAAGLILESTFTSTFRVRTVIPLYPFDVFNNIHKIKSVRCPIFIIHGTEDQMIPFAHGQKLFAAAPTPKLSFWVEKANHNNVIGVAGDRYIQKLEEFVKMLE